MMKSRHSALRAGRWTLIALAGIAAVAAAAATATVQTRTRITVQPQTRGTASARCTGGRLALAGGFAAPGFDPVNGNSTVGRTALRPAGKHGSKAKAFNFGNRPGELDSFAYCGKPKHAPRIRSKSVHVRPGSVRSVAARCPRGSVATAGGFGTPRFDNTAGPRVITLTSRRKGHRKWQVAGFNIPQSGAQARGTLTAYAYCMKPGARIITRSKRSTMLADHVRMVNVKCPQGARALSGGFDGGFEAFGPQISAAAAITSKRTADGRGWRTGALSIASPSTSRLRTYVYCVR